MPMGCFAWGRRGLGPKPALRRRFGPQPLQAHAKQPRFPGLLQAPTSSPLLSHLTPLLLGFSPSPAFFAHPHLPPRASPTSCLEPGAPRCSSSTKSPGCDSPSLKGGQEPAQTPKTLFLLTGSLQMSRSPPCWKAKPSPAGGQRCAGPCGIDPPWPRRTRSITKTQFWISQQPRAVPGAGTRSRSCVDVALGKTWRTSLEAVLQPPPAAKRTIPERINFWSLWF